MGTDDEPPRPAEPAVAADLVAEIERLAGDLATATATAAAAGDLAARLDHVVDLLIRRGHLLPSHRRLLDKIAPLRARTRAADAPVRLALAPDAPAVGPDIDCAALLHLCKARCCSLEVHLTEAEVTAGHVAWDLREPYRLARSGLTGYCGYLGAAGGCGAYAHRPTTCRQYDCRKDRRVWLDWDAKVPAPLDAFGIVIPLGEWPDGA